MSFMLPEYRTPNFESDALRLAPDAKTVPVTRDGVAPENYHSMGIDPEYFKVGGRWYLAEESRMDSVPVWRGDHVDVVEFRNLKIGDEAFVGRTEDGSEGIYVHANGFGTFGTAQEGFSFRRSRSRETGFSRDYAELAELLRYEKAHGGSVVWVLGPAFSFDALARENSCKLIENGYVHAVMAGNALATHDLEGAYLRTALGVDIHTQQGVHNGHYNHLDTINRARACGSIEAFVREEKLTDGIICTCLKHDVPFVLVGSVRDDGPLPGVYGDVYDGQNAMRTHISRATTVIGMATVLHTIATGNMTPSYRVTVDGTVRPVYFYSVDISEFATNKLNDRGSLLAKGIVANVQDFVAKLVCELGL